MPAAYAHLRFGRQVCLPGRYGRLAKNFPQLYHVGLQGPDPLFYHNPLATDAMHRLGTQLHLMTGQAFFTQALQAYRQAPSDGALAYLFGLLGHYCLDSRCHSLIDSLADDTASHTALETEFDRFLQQKDGCLRTQDRHTDKYIRLTRGERTTAAAFFPDVSPAAMGWGVGNMARIYRVSLSRKRWLSRLLMGLGGQQGLDMLPTVGPDPRCAHQNEKLLACYDQAAADYPALAQQLIQALEDNTELGEAFLPIFG